MWANLFRKPSEHTDLHWMDFTALCRALLFEYWAAASFDFYITLEENNSV
jgi:hypothetical protein